MTEQTVQVNPLKQYLLTVDEVGLAYLSKMVPSMRYLEVEGMSIIDQPNHHLLVTPKPSMPKTDLPVTDEASHAVV